MTNEIILRGARLHNLKDINLSIPKNKVVVLTGVSGSGKSTLGLDILHKEGQRQYLESLGLIPFGMARPLLDEITGLSPSISVDPNLTNRSPRSTVGTVTDVYTYLRLLYARLGHQPCPACRRDVPPSITRNLATWQNDLIPVHEDLVSHETIPCPHCGAPVPILEMAHFSFNKPAGACPTCTGLGVVRQVSLNQLVDEEKSLKGGAILGWNFHNIKHNCATLQAAANYYGFELDLLKPVKAYNIIQRDLLFYGVESPQFRRHFPGIELPALVRQGRFEGIATNLLRRYSEHILEAGSGGRLEKYLVAQTCPDCKGTRLRKESRGVTLAQQNITAASRLSLYELKGWVESLPAFLAKNALPIAKPIIKELLVRTNNLIDTGAGYLTLDRATPSLSAGETQRLRLASLLGSGLSGVLYVLDEPTIGTHPRDAQRLIKVLYRLRDLGNTVLVIEHDLEVIAAADFVVDLGPGGGKHGGKVVATGTPSEITDISGSITGDYLARRLSIPIPLHTRVPGEPALTLRGARQHNLKDISVRLPLGLLVAVTGVAGAGKSTLIFDILDRALRHRLYGTGDFPAEFDDIEGWKSLDEVVRIDQHHLRPIPRSNAATYTDIFTAIRQVFANTPEAKRLGFKPGHFSFNVPGGRCERCQGTGTLDVKMHFLPDVKVPCDNCQGRRYQKETLAVQYREHNISQVLELTMEEALGLFEDISTVVSRLQVLCDVGLGYLKLGQPATTLSGGEAQRVKLAKELGRPVTDHVLYLLDEPTTGLHLADTARLLELLQRLVEAGNSVIVVEHNLELVKAADWVIDLGLEGGEAGGRVVAEGSPESVSRVQESFTGRFLRAFFR